MAIIPSALANDMMNATQGADAGSAMQKLGDAIGKHIVSNGMLMFSWVGLNPGPPPVPDPVVVATGKFQMCQVVLAPTGPGGMTVLGQQITAGVMTATYNVDPPFSTSPGVMTGIPPLFLSPGGTDQYTAHLNLATQITTWLTSFVPLVPCAGQNAAFIGVATPTKIL